MLKTDKRKDGIRPISKAIGDHLPVKFEFDWTKCF